MLFRDAILISSLVCCAGSLHADDPLTFRSLPRWKGGERAGLELIRTVEDSGQLLLNGTRTTAVRVEIVEAHNEGATIAWTPRPLMLPMDLRLGGHHPVTSQSLKALDNIRL